MAMLIWFYKWLYGYVRCYYLGELGEEQAGTLSSISATFVLIWNYSQVEMYKAKFDSFLVKCCQELLFYFIFYH